MKTNKLIAYNIIILITILNTFYVFFGGGLNAFTLSKSFFLTIYQGATLIFLLWLTTLLVNLSHIVQKAKIRKNLLKISLIILLILTLFSIIGRIIELINGVFCISCWFNTILYIILTIIIIIILKDLYELLHRLFEH